MTDYTQSGKEMADRLFTGQGRRNGIGVERLCNELGELRARLHALEANTKQWRTDHLRLANTCAGMAEDRLEFFGKLLPDEERDPEGEIIDYYNKLAAQHAGGAVFHQDPSLKERVVMAITRDGEKARWDEARAAMLEIARWLELRAGGTRACWLLEREAQK